MKKIISLIVCVALCLCALAACGNQQNNSTPTTPNNNSTKPPVVNAQAGGMLLLNAGAAVQVTYDSQGLVMKLDSVDDNGATVITHFPDSDYVGMSCSNLICALITKSTDLGFASHDLKNIVIKQVRGSSLPGTLFLEDIVKDAQAAVTTDAAIYLITAAELDEDGYINAETARKLLQAHLGLNSIDSIAGSPEIMEQQYTFTATVGGRQNTYALDAVTGGFTGIYVQEPDYEHYYDPTYETEPEIEYVPEETEPTPTRPEPTEETPTTQPATTAPVEEPPYVTMPDITPETTEASVETAPAAE